MEKPNVGFVRTGSIVYNEDLKIENVWMPRKPFSKYSLFAGWWGLVQYLLDVQPLTDLITVLTQTLKPLKIWTFALDCLREDGRGCL